jgi:predicted short-subunit dehydrogenase-like oxidoreductase (DUF2520 family)
VPRPTTTQSRRAERRARPNASRPFYVVGCGAVGTALAAALTDAGWQLVGAWNRGSRRARAFGRRFGVRVTRHAIGQEIGQAALVLVTVSDRAIPTIGRLLAASKRLRAGTVVAHTSGALCGRALGRLAGAWPASFHPLAAVPADASVSLKSVTFAVEGAAVARRLLASAAASIGGTTFPVRPEHKARYHAACSMASNLALALVAVAAAEAERARIPGAAAHMLRLSEQALAAARVRGFAAALTGPIVRGDHHTVALHLAALSSSARPIYALLAACAVRVGRRAGLTRQNAAAIDALLAGAEGPTS